MKAIEELNELIGLDSVKVQVKSFVNAISIDRLRLSQGVSASEPPSYHMVFYGPPGTGKTTVARIMGKIFKELGILKKGHLVEVSRADLVGTHIGSTAPLTNTAADKALDGLLFIDEAYSLFQEDSPRDFGHEAIAALLLRMENNRDRLVVVMAGYTNEMNTLLNANPGMRSRLSIYITFEDYSPEELLQIFELKCKAAQRSFNEAARDYLQKIFTLFYEKRTSSFGNGRFARNFFDEVQHQQNNRLATIDKNKITREELCQFESVDFENAASKIISNDNSLGITLESLKDLKSSFMVKVLVEPKNSAEINPTNLIVSGEVVKFEVKPKGHNAFEGWYHNTELISNNTEFNQIISSDMILTAKFELHSQLKANIIPLDSGIVSGMGIYKLGEEVLIEAIANEGAIFKNWVINGQEIKESTTKTKVLENNTITAYFQKQEISFNIVCNIPDAGSCKLSRQNVFYNENVSVNIEANRGYEFKYSIVNGQKFNDKNYSIHCKENQKIELFFEKIIPINIKVSCEPQLCCTIEQDLVYYIGEQVSIKPVIKRGYKLSSWTLNGKQFNSKEISFVADINDILLEINLVEKPLYKIKVLPVCEADNIQANKLIQKLEGTGSYYDGEDVGIVLSPGNEYIFKGFFESNRLISKETRLRFMADRDRDIIAKFEEKQKHQVEIRFKNENNKAVVPSVSSKVINGERINYEAQKHIGKYGFSHWEIQEIKFSEELAIDNVITEDVLIIARYKQLSEVNLRLITSSIWLGSVKKQNHSTEYNVVGSQINVEAKLYPWANFEGWSVNDSVVSSINNPLSLLLDSDKHVLANFRLRPELRKPWLKYLSIIPLLIILFFIFYPFGGKKEAAKVQHQTYSQSGIAVAPGGYSITIQSDNQISRGTFDIAEIHNNSEGRAIINVYSGPMSSLFYRQELFFTISGSIINFDKLGRATIFEDNSLIHLKSLDSNQYNFEIKQIKFD